MWTIPNNDAHAFAYWADSDQGYLPSGRARPDALALFVQQAGRVAAVVTDITDADMGRLMLVRARRRIKPGIKIIVSTGRNDESQEAEMAILKVDACLLKPFTTRNLLLKLSHVLHPGLRDAA
ncbi:MAG: response regulator [Chthoniobacterales bacterium]|nr:response regulator [Chthoniobacterales bacterium]